MTNYNRQFTWLKRTLTTDTATGQEQETFSDNGTLWGSMKEVSASKRLAYGITDSVVDVQVNLRQFPDVSPNDRLQDLRFNYLLVIDGVMHDFDDNEVIIYAKRLPTLET